MRDDFPPLLALTGDRTASVGQLEQYLPLRGGIMLGPIDMGQFPLLRVGSMTSSGWDGLTGTGLDLSSAPTNSSGWALDSANDAAAFMGDVWLGGDLTLIGSGSFATGPSGARARLLAGETDATLRLSTGNADEELESAVLGQIGTAFSPGPSNFVSLILSSGKMAGAGTTYDQRARIAIRSAADNDAHPATIGLYAHSMAFNLETAPSMYAERFEISNTDAYISVPLSFRALDTDTYITSDAANQLNFYAGGVEMLRLTEDTTDHVDVLVDLDLNSNDIVNVRSLTATRTLSWGSGQPGNMISEVGPTGLGSTVLTIFDFHTGFNNDRDVRMLVAGGTNGSNDQGTIQFQASTFYTYAPAVRVMGSSAALHTGQDRSSGSGFFHGRNTNALGDVTVTRHVRTASAGTAELGYHSSDLAHKQAIHELREEAPLDLIDQIKVYGYDRKLEHSGMAEMLDEATVTDLKDWGQRLGAKATGNKAALRKTVEAAALHEWHFVTDELRDKAPQLLTRDGSGPSERAILALHHDGLRKARADIRRLETRIAVLENT